MKVKIKRLETGYIVSVDVPRTTTKAKTPESDPYSFMRSWAYASMSGESRQTDTVRYACKTLYEVCGLLQELFQDPAFIANDVMLCGDVVAKRRKEPKAKPEVSK